MRKSDVDPIPLTHLIRALIELGYCCRSLTYPQMYHAVLNGQIPAEQFVTNRWSVRRTDLPKVAATLSLALVSDASADDEVALGAMPRATAAHINA